ncbi:MAG: hypothetical protein HY017_30170 [Betaproteobacteria bacterium]|nr:hypothetical protein [Betaproteobacteria bacterium]
MVEQQPAVVDRPSTTYGDIEIGMSLARDEMRGEFAHIVLGAVHEAASSSSA